MTLELVNSATSISLIPLEQWIAISYLLEEWERNHGEKVICFTMSMCASWLIITIMSLKLQILKPNAQVPVNVIRNTSLQTCFPWYVSLNQDGLDCLHTVVSLILVNSGGSRPWAKEGGGAVFLRCWNKIDLRISLALPAFLPSAFFHYFFFCPSPRSTTGENANMRWDSTAYRVLYL